jgi:hypothetical protein
MWRYAVKKIALLAVLIFAPATWACWQTTDSPIKLHNTDIKVHFAYIGKAMPGAPVSLWSRRKGTISRVNTDQDGWVIFKDIPAGEYKVILQSPSYETFDVVLDSIGAVKTSMAVHFDTWDYCRTVRITVH